MLDDERNDVYLHVDARAVELFNQFKDFQLKKGKLIILKNRIAVHWGDLSQVEVEYRLFETALNNGPYTYYHLLSGVDLPIKTQDYIHEFFSNMQEKNLSDSGMNQAIVKMYTVKFIGTIYLPNILKKVLLLYMV